MNLFTVQLLLSLWCNLSTALSESADGGRPIYTCANAVTVGVRLSNVRIEGSIENESCSTTLVDPKTVFEP